MFDVEFIDLGVVSFSDARAVQEQYAERLNQGESGEICLICEHPQTLSLGRRTKEEDLGLSLEEWKATGIEIVYADRGGGPTFHAPGQVVIYPVVDLRRRGLGVRAFVKFGLTAIANSLFSLGISCEPDLEFPGLWLTSYGTVPGEAKKIGAVGLRIKKGITLHGFSVNLHCDLRPFNWFNPCGYPALQVGSALSELSKVPGNNLIEGDLIREQFLKELQRSFLSDKSNLY